MTADTFQVGEIALIVWAYPHMHFNGRECEILGPLEDCPNVALGKGHRISVQGVATENDIFASPVALKKLPPPSDPASWDRCVWRPEGVIA